MDDPSNSVRTFNGAMLRRIDKFCEQIPRKHGLYKPNRAPLGHPSEAQSRRETLDAKLTPERGRGQMLALRLRLETKPYWFRDERERAEKHHIEALCDSSGPRAGKT